MKNAFTIVELLVVIVVIGILAAITIVSYSGITERAYNAKVISIIDGYDKIFEMYYIDNSTYPDGQVEANDKIICLGEESDYPANSDFASGQCVKSETFGDVYVDEATNDELKSFMSGSVINGSIPTTSLGVEKYRGIFYSVSSGRPPELLYTMNGNADCARGEKNFKAAANITTCVFELENN